MSSSTAEKQRESGEPSSKLANGESSKSNGSSSSNGNTSIKKEPSSSSSSHKEQNGKKDQHNSSSSSTTIKKEPKESSNSSMNQTPKHSSSSKDVKSSSSSSSKDIKKEHQNGSSSSKTPVVASSSSSSSAHKDKSSSSSSKSDKKHHEKEVVKHEKSSSSSKHDSSSSSKNGKSAAAAKVEVKAEPKSSSVSKVKEEASKTASKSSSSSSKKRAADTSQTQESTSPKKRKKKGDEEEEEVWRWWEEKKYADGRKWTTLEHRGPLFEPNYVPLPDDVRFYYEGKRVRLSEEAEEVMTFYAKMVDHDYAQKDSFNTNFMTDWRKYMSESEKALIKDLAKCNFAEVDAYFKKKSEERKALSKEEKKKLKEEAAEVKKEYGMCLWDGHKQPIGNYKIEPPGLFRGRGEHPKMGMVKKRIRPEDVIINCGKDSRVPAPPAGHKWKEVRHDNMVAWLACWTENVQGNMKYVMLNAASRVKGERDWQKYEKARKLHRCIDSIRANYRDDWKSKEMRVRQRAVAIYFIDKLALRAGNEKDEDEADTVGCCSLRVEHVKLHKEVEGVGEHVVEFDFLGKDSIRYQNKVAVEKQVYKNLVLFMENKNAEDELFDRLNTTILNAYLNECMEGLSAKVFRTYNASRTLQEQLDQMTNAKDGVNDKILSYNRANRAVAILCNHQRAVPKTFAKSMENMQTKIQQKKDQISEAEKELKKAKSDLKNLKTVAAKKKFESKESQLEKLRDGLRKLEIQVTDKEENKDIALGTSKLNYLDPRISVAWCKKNQVPIEKIYSKTQRDKFRWAIDMATADYHFHHYEGEIVLRDLAYLEGMEGGGDGAGNTTQEGDETQNGDDDDEDEDDE